MNSKESYRGGCSGWFKWGVATIIALLAAGGGIVALLNYFFPGGIGQLPEPTLTSVPPLSAISPTIIDVSTREVVAGGEQIIYKDILFLDLDGDSSMVVYELMSEPVPGLKYENDPITAPPDEQNKGALVSVKWECGNGGYKVVLRAVILDRAGNTSEPFDVVFDCR